MSAKTCPDAASARREQPLPAGVGSAPAVRDRDRRDGALVVGLPVFAGRHSRRRA